MILGHTITRTQLENRVRGRRSKADIALQNNETRLMEEIMAKHNVDIDYLIDLDALTKTLAEHQTKRLAQEENSEYVAVKTAYEPGRRYDKVILQFVKLDKSPDPVVKYFVERATGRIYGPKSPTAPNTRWYFGTLKTMSHWDWSGEYATPTDMEKAEVRLVGQYGEFAHYEPLDAPVTTPKPRGRPRSQNAPTSKRTRKVTVAA